MWGTRQNPVFRAVDLFRLSWSDSNSNKIGRTQMNLLHRWLCSSSHWKAEVETHILPWTLEGLELGSNVLEVGPGYGVTTDLLRNRVKHLTCVEIDSALAQRLRRRIEGGDVTVLCESAAAMSLPDATFDGAVCF